MEKCEKEKTNLEAKVKKMEDEKRQITETLSENVEFNKQQLNVNHRILDSYHGILLDIKKFMEDQKTSEINAEKMTQKLTQKDTEIAELKKEAQENVQFGFKCIHDGEDFE